MKTILFIFISILIFSNCFADPEPPVIRGFIEITLIDGSKFQGALTIARPYVAKNYYSYASNGIYYTAGNFEGIMHFYIDLKSIEIYSETNSYYTLAKYEHNNWIVVPDMGTITLKYVACKGITAKDIFEFNDENISLIIQENTLQNYQFTDYLPLQLVVGYQEDTANIQKISLGNILHISMISNPSKALLDQLAQHREKINFDLSNSESGDGFNKPIWYHEIIADKKLYNEYLLRIKY